MRTKVLIISGVYSSYDEEEEVLGGAGAEVIVTDGKDRGLLLQQVKDVDGVLVNLQLIDATMIAAMERCKIISRYGVGYDNVDIDAAAAAGIWAANVPDYANEDVSDHALALLLGCIRKVGFRDRHIRNGQWDLMEQQKSRRTKGKTLGVVGLGNIGKTFLRKMAGFGLARRLVHDPYIDKSDIEALGAESVGLNTLLAESDYVSLHLPLDADTRHMIDGSALETMKENAVLVNTSRGGVVDTEALVEALREGRIQCAGLDVHETEPLPPDSALFGLENVLLSDHCAWYTEESLVELKTRAARNVAAVLRGGKPETPVNSPR